MSGDLGTGLGIAAIVLSLCLGLSTCAVVKSYSGKIDAETQQIQKQAK